ncbi:unnamed protein product, partial [Pylaiella littoralis]
RLCCACRRPGPSDNSTTRAWRHIGAGEWWDSLVEWEAAAAGTWPPGETCCKSLSGRMSAYARGLIVLVGCTPSFGSDVLQRPGEARR